MVLNANEDLPDPDTPVKTTNLFFGMSKSISLRLFSRAPRIFIKFAMVFLDIEILFSISIQRAKFSPICEYFLIFVLTNF